jgi:hypothetical protein
MRASCVKPRRAWAGDDERSSAGEAVGALLQRRLDDRRHLGPCLARLLDHGLGLLGLGLDLFLVRARGVERLARLAAVAVERDGLEAELPALV